MGNVLHFSWCYLIKWRHFMSLNIEIDKRPRRSFMQAMQSARSLKSHIKCQILSPITIDLTTLPAIILHLKRVHFLLITWIILFWNIPESVLKYSHGFGLWICLIHSKTVEKFFVPFKTLENHQFFSLLFVQHTYNGHFVKLLAWCGAKVSAQFFVLCFVPTICAPWVNGRTALWRVI